MDFLASALGDLIAILFDPVTYLVKLDENLRSLKKELSELKNLWEDVKIRVEDEEEQKFLTRTNQVGGWLQQVEVMEAEVEKIEAEFNQRWRILGNYHPNFLSSYKLGERVVKALREVAELKIEGSFGTVARRSPPDGVEEMPSTFTVGMDLMLQEALVLIRQDEVRILGIYGIGGVGKTTLLRKMNNVFCEQTGHFDAVIWVLVSKNSSLENIQKDIGDRLHLSVPENATPTLKANLLYKFLIKKKYLLLLDDVEDRLDLEEIGIPSSKTFKIAFTTRSKEVCTDMRANKMMKVDVLQKNEAWELFKKYVGREDVVDSLWIQPKAMKMVEKCGGLPLALITVGRAMANKTTVEEWEHAETTLLKSPTQIRGVDDDNVEIMFPWYKSDELRGSN